MAPRFNIEASSCLERNAEECAIEPSGRTTFSMRAGVLVLVGALLVLVLGLSAPGVRAAVPTLTILSPADHAVIGNGTPVPVIFVVSDFNLTSPGTGGPSPTQGHVAVYLDGVYYMAVTAFRPIPFSDLVDGKHTVQVQLVDDAGQPLTPDASDSVTFQIQFAPIVDINPYLQITQIILAGAIVFVLFYRGWGRDLLATLSGRVGRKNA